MRDMRLRSKQYLIASAIDAPRLIGSEGLSPVQLTQSCVEQTEKVKCVVYSMVVMDVSGTFESAILGEFESVPPVHFRAPSHGFAGER